MGASLRGTDLRRARLVGAVATAADFTTADLGGADLSEADLTGSCNKFREFCGWVLLVQFWFSIMIFLLVQF